MPFGRLLRLRSGDLFHRHGRKRAVIQHVFVVEKVEALKHHADLLTQGVQIDAQIHEILAVEPDAPGVGLLEQVDAAQQRRFSRTGGPDDADHFALVYLHVNALEHLQLAEGFLQLLDPQYRITHTAASFSSSLGCRAPACPASFPATSKAATTARSEPDIKAPPRSRSPASGNRCRSRTLSRT